MDRAGIKQHVAAFVGYLAERNASVRTRDRYGRVLAAFVAHCGRDDARIADVGSDAIASFLGRRSASTRPPSPATWNVELAVLRSFWKFLVRRGLADRDPTSAVEFARLPKRDAVYLTLAEFDALVSAIKASASRSYRARDLAIVTTAFHTGLRISSLLALNVANVDFDALTFRGVLVKGGHARDVAFNREVASALERYLVARLHFLADGVDEPALFVSDRGTRIGSRSVQVAFKRYLRAAGIAKPATFHSLRHSTATHLLAGGENLMVVAEQLHHANLNTTRRYVHLAEDARHRAVARLGARMRAERKARRAVARRAEVVEARP